MNDPTHNNALVNETSPYLLQHAHNPVNWYPWNEEALALAKEQEKPILLSIGYSACHWCHVMAHESFENEKIAALMNEHFINIKVDREERPDLDKIYQVAQQLLTQRTGGWPLTMFLTPGDQLPFFGGTYFPPESRYGLPGFGEVLVRIAEFFKERRADIQQQNRSVQEALEQISFVPPLESDMQLTDEPLRMIVPQLQKVFDAKYGGFGSAPKFPHPTNIERLLRHTIRDKSSTGARIMAETTMRIMAMGGVYDQVGGGFYRYSTDKKWMIPHFEKMLYDNGPLLTLYAQAYRITGNPFYKTIAMETANWIMRDMQSENGGYYSTIDADSGGEEGKFYTWNRDEVKDLLDEQQFAIIEKHLGLDQPANFEGHWHMHVTHTIDQVAEALSLDEDTVSDRLQQARKQLLEVRNRRTWPARDEKILTSWNGLMIKGMAVAAAVFNDEDCFRSAETALTFIQKNLWQDQRLLATCKDGRAHLNAYLDDYAFLIDAILSLLNYRWNSQWLEFAGQLADTLMEKFEDRENGGFYFTSHDHEKLIQRSKPFMDDSTPSGNGVAASGLLRLGHLSGETRYLEAAERTLRAAWHSMKNSPAAHNALLTALEEYLFPPAQVIIRADEPDLSTWRETCVTAASPFADIFPIPSGCKGLPGLLAERKPLDTPVAYVCEGHTCRAPVTRLDLLVENLNNPGENRAGT